MYDYTYGPHTVDASIFLPLATPAERQKYGETQAECEAVKWDIARKTLWLLRHDRDLFSPELVGDALFPIIDEMYDQRYVYVLLVQTCECQGEAIRSLKWDPQEGVRDRMLDSAVAYDVVPGDVVTTYTLPLPHVLGLLPDDSVNDMVFESVNEEWDDAVSVRHGECPQCGRQHEDAPAWDAEATLDAVLVAVMENSDATIIASEVERALRRAGHLPDVQPVYEDYVPSEDYTFEQWEQIERMTG